MPNHQIGEKEKYSTNKRWKFFLSKKHFTSWTTATYQNKNTNWGGILVSRSSILLCLQTDQISSRAYVKHLLDELKHSLFIDFLIRFSECPKHLYRYVFSKIGKHFILQHFKHFKTQLTTQVFDLLLLNKDVLNRCLKKQLYKIYNYCCKTLC